jgi:hypothetical protein
VTPTANGTRRLELLALSVADFFDMVEHHEAMRREFALLAVGAREQGEDVPARLLALGREIRSRFPELGRFREVVGAARERGEQRIDVELSVPAELAGWAQDYVRAFEQADEYCASGALLTLASPDAVVRFRRWLATEVAAQLRSGAAPTPCP